ncbi:MAG TPA: nicotinate phosphoribosyltransferase [Myxococcota bacterium]|nr:nicotinate phosphoribosyltransferase [Myxococcota bacterium]
MGPDTHDSGGSLALLTDLYQLTMAYGYWRHGLHDRRSVFQLAFRKLPFSGGYAIAAGLEPALAYLEGLRFSDEDLGYLGSLVGRDGARLFPAEFIDYLAGMRFTCDVDAIPEGRTVFPQEPLVRVTGPLIQAQLVETALLNLINFQTLVATKSARVTDAAKGDPVMEFGLRRAQGVDGALAASRAAYLGGCVATSNVLAGKRFGIPVRGTHAHAWVMTFSSEIDSFLAYAEAMPNNCVFLVDTYDTLAGVDNAIAVGQKLRAKGHDLAGIRLDSGDLAELSIAARHKLDAAGFVDAVIVASNDLDETLIESLKHQGAKIGMWGVGTKLVTAYDQPALGGVYKLAALMKDDGTWDYKIKLSAQPAKVSVPGILQVRRVHSPEGTPLGDVIYDEALGCPDHPTLIDPMDPTFRRSYADLPGEDLLVPVMRQGVRVHPEVPLETSRALATREREKLPLNMRRFLNPHRYPVGLEAALWRRRNDHILAASD